MAIAHADTVLSWHENYSKDEMPPEWMWPWPKQLENHFANVEEDRKVRGGSNNDDLLARSEIGG